MVSPSFRLAVCAVVGSFAGSILGTLFVPDPTGTVAVALTIFLSVVVAGVLYRTDWLREHDGVGE